VTGFNRRIAMDVKFNVKRLPVVVVTVTGFVKSAKMFTDKVVSPGLELVVGRNASSKLRLVLDLRDLTFVSESTATAILFQYRMWLNEKFDRVCLILPRDDRNIRNLTRSNTAFMSAYQEHEQPLLPLIKVTKRSREVKAFIETDRPIECNMMQRTSWPKYIPDTEGVLSVSDANGVQGNAGNSNSVQCDYTPPMPVLTAPHYVAPGEQGYVPGYTGRINQM
jgi:hypothetical protein